MTQRDILNAYVSARYLNQQRLSDVSIAKKIYQLMQKLQPSLDFQIQEEQKIYGAHPDYSPELRGCPIPEVCTSERRAELTKEAEEVSAALKALNETKVDPIDFEKFEFDCEKNKISISGEDIGNLEPFIEFI